jgi:hypothetical protein
MFPCWGNMKGRIMKKVIFTLLMMTFLFTACDKKSYVIDDYTKQDLLNKSFGECLYKGRTEYPQYLSDYSNELWTEENFLVKDASHFLVILKPSLDVNIECEVNYLGSGKFEANLKAPYVH